MEIIVAKLRQKKKLLYLVKWEKPKGIREKPQGNLGILLTTSCWKCQCVINSTIIISFPFFFNPANPTVVQRLRRGSLKTASLFERGINYHSSGTNEPSSAIPLSAMGSSANNTNKAGTAIHRSNTTVDNSNNATTTTTTTLATGSNKPRAFFKKRRHISSRSTESDSEGTIEMNPVSNNQFLTNTTFPTDYYDSNGCVDVDQDTFISFDQKSISSERDLMFTWSSSGYPRNTAIPLSPQYTENDSWENDEEDDSEGDDSRSVYSFSSERNRKRVCTRVEAKPREDGLVPFV